MNYESLISPYPSAFMPTKQPPKEPKHLTAPLRVTSSEAAIITAMHRSESTSRTDLARLTGWSRPKVTAEVARLIHRGILVEVGEGDSNGGRWPRLLKFNGPLGCIVGVDIGATSVDIAVTDLNARVLARDSAPADVRDEPTVLLSQVKDRIPKTLSRAAIQPEHVLGIGGGVPGLVDFANGLLVAPPLMPAWEGFSIRGFFHAIFPAALVMVDNDVNIMASAINSWPRSVKPCCAGRPRWRPAIWSPTTRPWAPKRASRARFI
jgi:hypothetical protein